jgi:hypothetical protein
MADFPTDGYLSDNARSEGEMKSSFESLNGAAKQQIGGSWELADIVAGAITGVNSSMLYVVGESPPTQDNLVSISTSSYPAERIIMLRKQPGGSNINVVHNAAPSGGQIQLQVKGDGDDYLITTLNQCLMLRQYGNSWYEVTRFNITAIDDRDRLGLGELATMDDGEPDAATLGGELPAFYLPVTGKAADSDLLDGVNGSAYARKDLAATQTFNGIIKTEADSMKIEGGGSAFYNAEATAGGSAGIRHFIAGSTRAQSYFDDSSDQYTSEIVDGGFATLAGVRFDEATGIMYYWDRATLSWKDVKDAQTLGGKTSLEVSASFHESADLAAFDSGAIVVADSDDAPFGTGQPESAPNYTAFYTAPGIVFWHGMVRMPGGTGVVAYERPGVDGAGMWKFRGDPGGTIRVFGQYWITPPYF